MAGAEPLDSFNGGNAGPGDDGDRPSAQAPPLPQCEQARPKTSVSRKCAPGNLEAKSFGECRQRIHAAAAGFDGTHGIAAQSALRGELGLVQASLAPSLSDECAEARALHLKPNRLMDCNGAFCTQ
ncbi:MAG: hypothetical protein ABSC06_39575 [Rhodopila sp.]